MSFPRYPAYKPSGVEWLGEVPEHWEVKPLKRVAEIQTGLAKGKEVEPEGSVEVPFLRVANVQDNFLDLENVHMITIQESSLSRYLLRPGDVLMNEGGDFDKLGRGCIWDGVINPCIHQNHVFAVRPHSICPSWLNAYTSSKQANSYFISRSKQSTNLASISSSNLMDLPVPIAPNSETEEILGFLDRETAKIDALIVEQQRLIELLQEKRQAVISHAVTKGLNPNAPMKDSGVEWLGEVPEHWEVKPLKHLTRQISVGVVVEPSKYYDDQGTVPALRSLNIKAEEIQMDDCVYITEESNELLKKSRLCAGDLVVVRTGQPGTCAVIPDELDNCNCIDLIFIRKPRDGDSSYLMLSLSSDSSRYQYAAGAEGAIQQHFNVKTASELVVPWPPEEEQSQIRVWLMRKTSDVDRLTSIAVQSIELLEERRSALISAAVTGQIDVRGLVEAEAGEQ